MTELYASNLFDVKGRTALVTGGSSGIGLLIAKTLVSNSAKVYITALETDDIEGTVDALNSLGAPAGGQAIGFPGNVSSKDGILAIFNFVSSRESHLDILISNAGIRRDPPKMCNVKQASLDELQQSMWSSRESDWNDTFKVNVTAHYFLSVVFLKLLVAASERDLGEGIKGRDRGCGGVLITSSCASMHNCTNIDLTSYASSKAAIDHLVKLLASKYAPWYVRVNSLNPGFFDSAMNPVSGSDNQFASLLKVMPAGRIGRPMDIGGAVLYLCSEAGSYVDGVCLCLDGGRILLANGQ